jgi:CRISPR-associated protein Csb2
VEIAFSNPVAGPLIIGDGRYLGLGLIAPVRDVWRDKIAFSLGLKPAVIEAPALLRAVRRALMALSRDALGLVPRLFSGHEGDGGPARSGRHEHVFLAADDADGDGYIDRLIVAAPWACDLRYKPSRRDRERFDRVVSIFEEVRAVHLGVLKLSLLSEACSERDPLMGPARLWESRTFYRPTRHAGRRQDRIAAVEHDLIGECLRRGLPRPGVEVLELETGPRGGATKVRARLEFAVGVRGPLLLGRDSHMGGGLFVAA